MKQPSIMVRLVLAAAIVALSSAVAAEDADPFSTPTDVRNEIGMALQEVAAFPADERERAVARAREGLNRLDAEIARRHEALRAHWPDLDDAARDEARLAMARLHEARNALGEALGALQGGPVSSWEDLTRGVSDAFDELAAAWREEDALKASRDAAD